MLKQKVPCTEDVPTTVDWCVDQGSATDKTRGGPLLLYTENGIPPYVWNPYY